MKKTFVIVLILVAAAAFYAGTLVSSKKDNQKNFPNGNGNFNGQQFGSNSSSTRGLRDGNNGNLISGELLSKDAQSLTIKLSDGGSKIVLFSNSTQIMKSTAGTLDDLQTGNNLMITGTSNDDGSLTAQNIQLRPAGQPAAPNSSDNAPDNK